MKDLVVEAMDLTETRAAVKAEYATHKPVIDAFHRVFYASRHTHTFTNWCGVPILKNPLDLHVYQEILWDLRPTLILETGTAYGGSALYLACMLDRRGEGRVVSVDVEPHETPPQHPRITYLRGSSVDPSILATLRAMIRPQDRVMVILDSDHSKAHVLQELECYAPMVTLGQFMVVEDTNINGNPIDRDWMGGPGPGDALKVWLPEHPEFEQDVLAERMLMTFYPGGWLRKVA